MARHKLILVVSDKMDTNKKKDRNENGLIRMAASTRNFMNFNEEFVEIWPQDKDTKNRLSRAMFLKIFKAFSADIKKLRDDGMSEDEIRRAGFVTSKTFQKIMGTKAKANINESVWIADDIHDTVIGADPEFLLFDNQGKIVKATDVLPKAGKVGNDGAMAEVRPDPAIDPRDLTGNIMSIFKDKNLISEISDYDWIATCYYKDAMRDYPVGGHIHIGNPVQIARMDPNQRQHFFKVFNKIVDELLALPMIKLDGADLGSSRRTKCEMGKYGFFGEFRISNGRLEHRTLSGVWLAHPDLATMVFGTAKAIIDTVFKLTSDHKFNLEYMLPTGMRRTNLFSNEFNSWKDIPLAKEMGCIRSSKSMNTFLNNSNDRAITKKFLDDWLRKMKRLDCYGEYSQHIRKLYELLSSAAAKEFRESKKNIKENWLGGKKFII